MCVGRGGRGGRAGRGRERIGERVYDKDENRRNARLGFVDFVPRGENNDACVRVSEGPLRLRRRVRGRVSATREAQGRVSPPNRLELCHAVVVRARASRFRKPPPRPHATHVKRLSQGEKTNPRNARDARSAVLERTWSLSARRRRSSRSVSFPNRSALVCRRTRSRLGNGQASPGSVISPGCVASEADTLTRHCLPLEPRLGMTNAGIVRSKRATRHEVTVRRDANGATGVRLESVEDPRGRHCRGTTAAFVKKYRPCDKTDVRVGFPARDFASRKSRGRNEFSRNREKRLVSRST